MRQDLSQLEEYVFPDLLHLAHYDDDGDIATKSVSEVYKKFIKMYTKIAAKYAVVLDQEFDTSLFENFDGHAGSHGCKKYSVKVLDDSPLIQPTWTVFRAGWVMRNAHTVFDYLFGNSLSDQRCARVLSGWSVPDHSGQVGGAVSPTLDSCSGDIIKFYIF